MTAVLTLLNTPALPSVFSHSKIIQIKSLVASSSPKEIKQSLTGLDVTPETILGSKNTPALHWFIARNTFPSAALICHSGDNSVELNNWLDLNTGDALGHDSDQSHSDERSVEPTEASVIHDSAAKDIPKDKKSSKAADDSEVKHSSGTPSNSQKAQSDIDPSSRVNPTLSDGQLLNEIFRKCSWGLQSEEAQRTVDSLVYEGINRPQRTKQFAKRVELARLDGTRGFGLAEKLKQRINGGEEKESLIQWIELEVKKMEVGEFRANRMRRHLMISLEKALSYQKKRKAKKFSKKSNLQPVKLDESGFHPNSIRNLSPTSQWEVLIDETGDNFELDQIEEINSNSVKLGRVVALVLAQGHESKLVEKKGFHATEAKDEEIDTLLNHLFKASKKVGIIGFSMKDASRNGWLSQIEKLIYTVLMQLPLLSNAVRVNFNIEQRSGFTPHVNLQALEELLITRLRAQFPGRYDKLNISLKFISKDGHPYNAYVDAIAHMWGSPAQASKDRLRKSALLGHCLLRKSDEQSLEKLTWLLEDKRTDQPLLPSDWYQLCEGAEFDSGSKSLLSYYLSELGKHTKHDTKSWQSYLDYVLQKISNKDYTLTGLGFAINWLSSCQPEGNEFTPMMELHYSAARLAVANHQGKVLKGFIASSLSLSEQYIDQLLVEDAPAVGNLILKIAVMTTNAFEFSLMTSLLEKCLSYSPAVFGIKTYSKIQSQLAQLYAFMGESQKANELFISALEGFKKLSDKTGAARELSQTTTYLLINQMSLATDSNPEKLKTDVLSHLKEALGKKGDVSKVAISGDLPSEKYSQHLLLRAMVINPNQWSAEIQSYISKKDCWVQGASHPWALILAYRGWLLSIEGKQEESYAMLKQASQLCLPDNLVGPTIEWIGLVIQGITKQLHQEKSIELDSYHLDALLKEIPALPKETLMRAFEVKHQLDHGELIDWLEQCLPFNFH